MNDPQPSGDGSEAYRQGIKLIESGQTDEGIAALVRAERSGYSPATTALDSMVTPLPGEHPISLENRRAALRQI